MYNFNHLYYFYIAAKLKSITRAASELHTSQPSLSTQIKTLEGALGFSLFERRGRQLELTEEGMRVFQICHRMFEVAEDLIGLQKGDDPQVRNLTIAVSPQIERPFISHVVSATMKRFKDDETPVVHLLTKSDSEMRVDSKLHKLDLMITNFPIYDEEFETLTSFDMPVGMVGSPELLKELGIVRKASLGDVLRRAARHLVLPAPQLRLRQETDLFLQKRKLPFHMVFETDIIASLISALRDGIGIGFLPITYVLKELKSGELALGQSSLDGLWPHRLTVVGRKHAKSQVWVSHLIDVLLDEEDSITKLKF